MMENKQKEIEALTKLLADKLSGKITHEEFKKKYAELMKQAAGSGAA